jgi:hypothetical protein
MTRQEQATLHETRAARDAYARLLRSMFVTSQEKVLDLPREAAIDELAGAEAEELANKVAAAVDLIACGIGERMEELLNGLGDPAITDISAALVSRHLTDEEALEASIRLRLPGSIQAQMIQPAGPEDVQARA